jgi:hypothetical protein
MGNRPDAGNRESPYARKRKGKNLTPLIDSTFGPAAPAPDLTEAMSHAMTEFLAFIAIRQPTFEQAMEAWGSNLPQLTTWEDAWTAGLIAVLSGDARIAPRVHLTTAGLSALRTARRDRIPEPGRQDQQGGKK